VPSFSAIFAIIKDAFGATPAYNPLLLAAPVPAAIEAQCVPCPFWSLVFPEPVKSFEAIILLVPLAYLKSG
jgi:hypothetical protein